MCEGLGLGRAGDSRARHTVFEYLLHGFTEPDEVLGPVDIAKLQAKEPSFERLRRGSLVEADVIFLDEVFRANSTILNALLSIMNERQVYEGGHIVPARARLVFGASNSVPVGRQLEELRAFYERFIIRVESEPIPIDYEAGNEPSVRRQRLLTEGWAAEVRELRRWDGSGIATMPQIACLNDFLLLNRALTELWGGESLEQHTTFLRDYHGLVAVVMQDEVAEVDDRKFIRLLTVMRAHSLFMHLGPPELSDLVVLRHTWSDLEGKARLDETVQRFIKETREARRRARK
jgi:MoxR-like ATPase